MLLAYLDNIPGFVSEFASANQSDPRFLEIQKRFTQESLEFFSSFAVQLVALPARRPYVPIKQPVPGDFMSSLTYIKDVFVRIVTNMVTLAIHPEEFANRDIYVVVYDLVFFDKKLSKYDFNFSDKQTPLLILFFILFFLFGYFFLFIQELVLRVCFFNKKYVQIWRHNLKTLSFFVSKRGNLLRLKNKLARVFTQKFV
jgi:hypothetical protein